RPLAVRPSLRPVMPLPLEVDEGAQAFVHLKDDASPVASVASIRPAGRHVLLAPEADGAVPSVAPLRHDFRPVDKHAAPPDTKAPDPEPAGIQCPGMFLARPPSGSRLADCGLSRLHAHPLRALP